MSAGSMPASVSFSPRQKQLLQAMGYTVWRPVQRIPARQRLALELDRSTLDSPVFKAMLAFVGLDIAQALAHDLPGERLSLTWAVPGTTLVLPGTAELRRAAVKRRLWPALRALRRHAGLA